MKLVVREYPVGFILVKEYWFGECFQYKQVGAGTEYMWTPNVKSNPKLAAEELGRLGKKDLLDIVQGFSSTSFRWTSFRKHHKKEIIKETPVEEFKDVYAAHLV